MPATGDATDQELRRILVSNAWFASLPAALQDKIISRGTVRTFPRKAVVSAQGSTPKAMSAVLEGHVRVTRVLVGGEENLYHVGDPGFWFGPLALVTNEKTTVAVIADTDVRIFTLSKAQFERIAKEDPSFYRYLALFIAERYAGLLRHVSDSRLISPEERVCAKLAALLRIQRPDQQHAGPVTVKVSQVDLAAMVGVSRQTLNELLKKLERRGLIEIAFRSIRVVNPALLRDNGDY
ncbi:cyclic nucleotide-binding protein [Cupriavidus sp. TKC]|uniref:Crp/Fnr family transcriptional regulator n=2 Tax=Cupriavidus TaxID=106589 RepID=UPI000563FB1E|nr:Crp/Fnr family transcriptional regulator [Cupriavidus metallidurans]GMG94099.1 cyclic nucleotide-binding protein [Cupriavidus sp. TKC]HBD38762.1 Crp/Fnr family transcriptional regulator [Cupriavidus sp.]